MEKNKKKKTFELYTNNETIINVLNDFKNNKKIYLRILEFLQLIGNFEGKTEIELYETHDTDDKKEIKIWLSDLDGNIFILTPLTTSKADISKIEKLTNDNHLIYDLSLAKKFKLTSDNVRLTQTGRKYDFKFGRLITDTTTFFNLFLSDNICYQLQLQGNETPIDIKILLSQLNKFKNMPTFKEYIEIFDNILTTNNIQYETISMTPYKDFKNLGSVSIINEESNHKKLTKNKEI